MRGARPPRRTNEALAYRSRPDDYDLDEVLAGRVGEAVAPLDVLGQGEALTKHRIEILTFDGCPNREHAIALVSSVVADTGADAEVRVVDVPDTETAQQTRFLGSPTIRVDGRDIEPGADERTEYMHSCRVFRTETGLSGEPDPRWLRAALSRAAGV